MGITWLLQTAFRGVPWQPTKFKRFPVKYCQVFGWINLAASEKDLSRGMLSHLLLPLDNPQVLQYVAGSECFNGFFISKYFTGGSLWPMEWQQISTCCFPQRISNLTNEHNIVKKLPSGVIKPGWKIHQLWFPQRTEPSFKFRSEGCPEKPDSQLGYPHSGCHPGAWWKNNMQSSYKFKSQSIRLVDCKIHELIVCNIPLYPIRCFLYPIILYPILLIYIYIYK